MPIYLSGQTFENRFVTPAGDGAVFEALVADGISTGCAINYTGTTLKIAAGKMVFAGRVVIVPSATDIPCTGASSGYARVVLTIDLSKTATETTFEQVALDVQYATSINGFPSLTKEAINNGGTVYKAEVCVVSLAAAGITGIVRTCGPAHAKAQGITVTIPASKWSNNRQTINAPVKASDNCLADSLDAAYGVAGVKLIANGDGTLTFTCLQTPVANVSANILLM